MSITAPLSVPSTRPALDQVIPDPLADAHRDTAALVAAVAALAAAASAEDAVDAALSAVREQLGWTYAAYWSVDATTQTLAVATESGSLEQSFHRAARGAAVRRGEGVLGQAWLQRVPVVVDDLDRRPDCLRSVAARRAGAHGVVCVPLLISGEVVGVLEFVCVTAPQVTPERRAVLDAVGGLVAQTVERHRRDAEQEQAGQDIAAVATVLREVSRASGTAQAMSLALDTIRRDFGWDYASYWQISDADGALHFVQESGTVNDEFRTVTQSALLRGGRGPLGPCLEGARSGVRRRPRRAHRLRPCSCRRRARA